MTPGTFGPYILTALPYAGAEALRIAIWCIAITGALLTAIRLALWIRDGFRLLRDLMDNGDGQGGVPYARRQQAGLDHLTAIAADQQHGKAEARTEALSMRDVTVRPVLEALLAERARCPRCRADDHALPCGCGMECWSAHCLGGIRTLPGVEAAMPPVEWLDGRERGFR